MGLIDARPVKFSLKNLSYPDRRYDLWYGRIRIIRYLVAGATIGSFALIAAMFLKALFPPRLESQLDPLRPAPDRVLSDRRVVLQDFSTTEHSEDGQAAFRIEIKKCELRPGRTGLFNRGLSQIAEARGVQIHLFSRHQPVHGHAALPQDPTEAINSIRDLSRLLRWESVRALEIRDATVHLHQENQGATCIKADKVVPGRRDQLILEGGVTVTATEGRKLAGDRIIWWSRLGILAVKGPYTLQHQGGEHHGERSLFDLRLGLITNPNEIREYEKRAQQ